MRTPFRATRAATAGVSVAAVLIVAVVAVALSGAVFGPGSSSPSPVALEATQSVAPSSTPSVPASPSLVPEASPSLDPSPSDSLAPSNSPLPSPSATAGPTPSPAPYKGPLVATRVVVPALRIDLAITKSPPAGVYPYCNVAMSFGKPFGQPGQSRATYLFAHARVGMFYPIYNLTMLKRTPNKMVGMVVNVYTSDSKLHVYKVSRVLPHQLTLNRALASTHDQLWLQTSEGPHGTPGKTQVVAEPVSISAASYAASHPKVHIVKCGT